jgi:polysaccharide biosynthesis transport protein
MHPHLPAQTGQQDTIAIDVALSARGKHDPMTEPESDIEGAPGLTRALSILGERAWVIALCVVVTFGAAVAYSTHKPNVYTASASLEFTNNSLPAQVAGVGSGQSLDPEGEKSTNVQLVTTTPVATAVVKALKLSVTPGELLGQVSASDPQNDAIVDVAVADEDPARAAEIANAFAQQFVLYSQQQNEQQLIKGQQLIAERAARLPADDTVDRANLTTLAEKLLVLQAVATADARVVNTATPPGAPSSPNTKGTAIVAIIFGLLLGVGLAVLLHMLNRRVDSIEAFEQLYGIRALAGVPRLTRTPRTREEREADIEPFRMLQNSLSLVGPGRHVRKVLVTSAVPGEGKTTVAIGLARAAAQSGSSVVLVEGDLRRPSFAERLRVDGRAEGLGTALFDGVDPQSLYQLPFSDLPHLHVLAAGPVRAEAAARMRPFDLTRVFETIASDVDLVVIDSAPLLPVVDTRVLLDELNLDAYLVVGRAGFTKRDEIREARPLLERRQLHEQIGLVINGLPGSRGNYYYEDEQPPPPSREPRAPEPEVLIKRGSR